MSDILKPAVFSKETVASAVSLLSQDELVAFPTETVYGLGCNAASKTALSRLYAAKGRPDWHPVIVHLSSVDQIKDWAINIPDAAWRLANTFCPGPLTLILPKAAHVLDQVTGGQINVGLRIPSHPVAQALLLAFGGGIAAPSANKFGRVSATSASHVISDLGQSVAMVIEGGPCQVGIESTIVDFSKELPVILRPGLLAKEELELVAGVKFSLRGPIDGAAETRAPGTLKSHYAPVTPLMLLGKEELDQKMAQLSQDGRSFAVLHFPEGQWARMSSACLGHVCAPRNAKEYASALYANLRKLDSMGADIILVETPPTDTQWIAVNDRLQRAASTE